MRGGEAKVRGRGIGERKRKGVGDNRRSWRRGKGEGGGARRQGGGE